jgi:DNA topoisomerase-1
MAVALMQFDAFDTAAQAKRNIRDAIKAVAALLGNTPTICRKCYVHPALLEGEFGRLMASKPRKRTAQEEHSGLKPEEAAGLALLRAHQRNDPHQTIFAAPISAKSLPPDFLRYREAEPVRIARAASTGSELPASTGARV